MKKLLIALISTAAIAVFCAFGCNRQMIDLTYSYDRAAISLPNGETVEGKVDSWRDYEDGDQMQVTIDGTTYLVHAVNVVLIKD